jgi:hypothetical protein
MNEKKIIEKLNLEVIKIHEESHVIFGGISVIEKTTGAMMSWNQDKTELKINVNLFSNKDAAYYAALQHIAQHIGLAQAIRTDANVFLKQAKKYPKFIESILRWQGLVKLKEKGFQSLKNQQIASENQTFVQEFAWALDSYVLNEKLPSELSPEVRSIIEKIPKHNGKSLIDYIASGNYLNFDGINFEKYIQPLADELKALDQQTGRSEQFEYRPSQTQDLATGDKEAIRESNVTTRVNPFYGGYYREQVCRYDPDSRQIIRDANSKEIWDVKELPDDENIWRTKKTYYGTFVPKEETLIKLPYEALPIISTLEPSNKFRLLRDRFGTVYLGLNRGMSEDKQVEFSFNFVLHKNESNTLNQVPTEQDLKTVGGRLDSETQELIDDLSTQTGMSNDQKGRYIVRYIHKKLRYPNDDEEIAFIYKIYSDTVPQKLWLKIHEFGVADCYWANIFRDELCKRVEVASRIATGPYISSKDPRFKFTIIEAPGVDKHAWGEIWTGQEWTHKGMDATPPKQKKENDEELVEPLDGDFGESSIDQPELSLEEIEQAYQDLIKQDEYSSNQPKQPQQTPEQRAAEQFEQEKGILYEEWRALEEWINNVNNTHIPAEMSINKKSSTLYQEWRNLLDLLYKKREVPYKAYKGPVRQSEGEFLSDPVMAYIDIKSRNSDPLGYQRLHEKKKDEVKVAVFDDDFILDTSGSMRGIPSEEQRKMVMSSLYNIRGLNQRLSHSNNSRAMTTPLSVHSRVAVFGDWTSVTQESTDTISEKNLIEINEAIQAKNETSAGLHESLVQYQKSLDPKILQQISKGEYTKVLTIVSDGNVKDKSGCTKIITQLRQVGIIVQGIGFGSRAQDIKVICHDPSNQNAAVVIDDVRQATLTRHRLLMEHLSKL